MLRILIGCICLITSAMTYAVDSVKIRVIDRGQADGILIQTPNNKWIVIDGGTNKKQAEGMRNVWAVDEVQLAIVSHRHFDHLGGMDDIINSFTVKQYVGITDDCPTNVSDNKVFNALTNKAVPVTPLSSSPIEIVIDQVKFTILPLPSIRSSCPSKENLNSVVVRLDYGEFSMLFTGDAEETELDWLVANHAELLDVDVLKASHHGSDNGLTDEFLNAVAPNKVVISAGVNAKYGHPMAGAVDAYESAVGSSKVYCTNRHGTIRVFGYAEGNSRVYKQQINKKDCTYDGTYY